jgi:solute carrier family 35 (UDP-galactose transporter), member B1
VLVPFGVGALLAVALISADFFFFAKRRSRAAAHMNGASNGTNGVSKGDSLDESLSATVHGSAATGIAALPSELRLLICAGGIYACYLTYGVLQEEIYKFRGPNGEKFTATMFLLLVQCVVNALFAWICMAANGRSGDKMPLGSFALTGASYIGAMLFSNEALKYVSYPVQALGKSCKMVPVMLFGVLIRGKKYKFFEYACVFLVTAGITAFQLSGKAKKGDKEDSPYGILLLGLSLAMDGVTGAVQDQLKTKCKPTVHEFMFFTNAAGVVICAALVVLMNQLVPGVMFCVDHPEMVRHLAVFSLTSALGQNFIFLTLKNFDALVLTTVTTTRKFFTILVSVVMYGHQLNRNQWLSVGVVFVGLSGEIFEVRLPTVETQRHHHHHHPSWPF